MRYPGKSFAVLCLLAMVSLVPTGCARESAPAASPIPTPSPLSTLSEQPDTATFNQYFSEMCLARMPPGKTSFYDLEKNVTVFNPGDVFNFYYSTLGGKEVAISPRLYDVEQKKVVGDFRFMGPGANGGPLTLPPSKYEVKVYVGDVLVAVLPFEVVQQPSTPPPTPTATPSAQPDQATFKEYFSEMGLGRLPEGGQMPFDLQKNVTVFSPGDKMQLYGTVIQEVQITAQYYDVTTKQSVVADAPSGLIKPGTSFAGGGTLNLPSGKYEYKVYVGDVLVAVFPFRVQ